MRIIRGTLKGRKLSCPRGKLVRPTTDRVRESLFQILESAYGKSWPGVRVIDLFAGSGILGIEALSRGARSGIFVEKDRQAASILKKNIEICGLSARARLIRSNVFSVIKAGAIRKYAGGGSVVFADPPYGKGISSRLLGMISETGFFLSERDLVIVEESSRTELVENFQGRETELELQDKRVYGDTALFFYAVGPS